MDVFLRVALLLLIRLVPKLLKVYCLLRKLVGLLKQLLVFFCVHCFLFLVVAIEYLLLFLFDVESADRYLPPVSVESNLELVHFHLQGVLAEQNTGV